MVEIGNGKMGVKYVKDGEVGWNPVGGERRRKVLGVRSERVVGI